MKINDIVNSELNEMALSAEQWKGVSDSIVKDGYDAGAKTFYDFKGDIKGAKRSWNSSQKEGKAGKLAGQIDASLKYEELDKAYKKKYADELATTKEEKATTTKEIAATKEKDTDVEGNLTAKKAEELSAGLKGSNDLTKRKTPSTNTVANLLASSVASDAISVLSKEWKIPADEVVAQLKKDFKRKKALSKRFEEYAKVAKIPFAKRTPEQRESFTKNLKKITPSIFKKGYEIKQTATMKTIDTVEDFKGLISSIKKETARNLTSGPFQKEGMKAIVRISNKSGIAGKAATSLNTLLNTVTGGKGGANIADIVKNTKPNVDAGISHVTDVDSFLEKYDQAVDISQADVNVLVKSIEKMMPTMEADKTTIVNKKIFDKEGLGVYQRTLEKLKAKFPDIEKNNPSLDVDDLEEAIDAFSKYHDKIKKEITAERKAKLNVRTKTDESILNPMEDILYNLNEDIQLDEGIFFFKDSKKLKRYIVKLSKGSSKLSEEEQTELDTFLEDVRKIAVEFETLEKKFKGAPFSVKKTLKKEHAVKTKKYFELIKSADDITPIIKKIGKIALFAGLLYLVGSRYAGLNSDPASSIHVGGGGAAAEITKNAGVENYKARAAIGFQSAALDKKAAGIAKETSGVYRSAAKELRKKFGKYIGPTALDTESKKAADAFFKQAWSR